MYEYTSSGVPITLRARNGYIFCEPYKNDSSRIIFLGLPELLTFREPVTGLVPRKTCLKRFIVYFFVFKWELL